MCTITRKTKEMNIQQKFISIFSLYNYTQNENFYRQLHLVFLIEDFPEILLNETNAIIKAASCQQQYLFTDHIKLLNGTFGEKRIETMTLRQREASIETKVENIIALDIALLKFIASVPERIEQNSFKLPRNVDKSYMMNEYMTIMERQIILKISQALKEYQQINVDEIYTPAKKLRFFEFQDTAYIKQLPSEEKLNRLTQNQDELYSDYLKLNQFVTTVFKNSNIRSMMDGNSQYIQEALPSSIDTRQVLYSMTLMFMYTENRNYMTTLRDAFQTTPDIDQDESQRGSSKRRKFQFQTQREAEIYIYKIIVLLVHFMYVEEQYPNVDINTILQQNLIDVRNQLILILTRMIDHLLMYIQFKNKKDHSKKLVYSKLPIRDTRELNATNQQITFLLYVLQYTLNFAPFLIRAS